MKSTIFIAVAVVILGMIALFTIPQGQKRENNTVEYTEHENQAEQSGVPTALKVRSDSKKARRPREQEVQSCADEWVGLFYTWQARREQGKEDPRKNQNELAEIRERLKKLSSSELHSLVKKISEESTLSQDEKVRIIEMAQWRLSEGKPESSLAIFLAAREITGLKYDSSTIGHTLSRYAENEPAAAYRWLNEHRDRVGEISELSKQKITAAIAKEDVIAAMELINRFQVSDLGEFFEGLPYGVNASNAAAFMGAIRGSNVTAAQHAQATRALPQTELFEDFNNASEWLEKAGLTTDERDSVVSSLAYEMMEDEPDQWVSWVYSSGASSKAQFQAAENIIGDWARADFVAAGEWINAQPESKLKNDSSYHYAQALASHEPAAAAEWANTLPASEDLPQLIEQIYQSYQKKDPEAAAAFAARHGLE